MQKHRKTQKKQGGKRKSPSRGKTTRVHRLLKSIGYHFKKIPSNNTIILESAKPTKIQIARMKKLPHLLNLVKQVKK